MCEHLEVSGFATYSVVTDGGVEIMTLQECMSCNAYLTLDSKEISPSQIIEKITGPKTRMRTVTAQINSELYEKLQDLVKNEASRDTTKIMSEIVALGIEQYRKLLSQQVS